jgi:serine/threonine protein kinase
MNSWGFREGEEIGAGRHAVRLLGGGRRYEAWLAWDDRLRSLVVAKVVRPDQVADGDGLAALEHEARLLARLAHPLLVRCFGVDPRPPHPHLVLEFLEGPRLSTLVRRYGVILEQALPLALNLCSALHYLSREQVVHLDVKPRNIIMAGDPRLIDLSVARAVSELGSLRAPVGTDAYMAPEQCEPSSFGLIGPASDIWGLGVTLHETLTRELPYPRPSEADPFPQLTHEPRSLAEVMPAALAELVMACLERSPAARPTAAELGDALEPLLVRLPAPRIGNFRPGSRELMTRLEAG